MTKGRPGTENAEKRRVTLVSLAVAVFLIALKLFAGLSTGYLTLISEALHSSLDALVAIITFFSIRYAEKPADAEHPYGHGKAENLAAFTESLLLFFAISLILREVVERLFFKNVVIKLNVWAVAVLAASVLCDMHRYRALRKVALKYKSPAIEADSVHFRADFITSAIALSGILVAYFASTVNAAHAYFLADIATTCLVLLVVTRMVLRILTQSAGVLLDRTAAARTALIREIAAEAPEVIDVEKIRTREAGKQTFVDLTVDVDRNVSVEKGYSIGKRVEEMIKEHIQDVDVLLQVKPIPKETEDIVERIRSVGAQAGCNLHHITLHKVAGRLHADVDLEVEGYVKLSEAHALSDKLEARIKEDNPAIGEVNTHIDWRTPSPPKDVSVGRDAALIGAVEAVVRQRKEVIDCRRISVEEESPGELALTIHCTMPPDADASAVREVSEDLEKRLKEMIGGLGRVIIHVEPEG
jgi:cation diffusion facilitator family transporter